MSLRNLILLPSFIILAAPVARAQESAPAPVEAQATASDKQPASAAALSSVVRGFYIEGRVGGGYALADAKIKNDPIFPTLAGKSESLGAGATVHFAVGYDVTPKFALQALGGALFISGQRRDRVRDLGIVYGGVGGRLAIDVAERLDVLISAGAAGAQVDDGVDEKKAGLALTGGIGLEYYVHVRHFSVGLELAAFAPLSPTRVFLGLSPQVKYTF